MSDQGSSGGAQSSSTSPVDTAAGGAGDVLGIMGEAGLTGYFAAADLAEIASGEAALTAAAAIGGVMVVAGAGVVLVVGAAALASPSLRKDFVKIASLTLNITNPAGLSVFCTAQMFG